MKLASLGLEAQPIAGALPAFHASVDAAGFRSACEAACAQEGRLVALWASDETRRGGGCAIHAALAVREGLLWLTHPLPHSVSEYPGIADLYPAAARMQRTVFDMLGVRATTDDRRKWLRHAAWPQDAFPLRKDFPASSDYPIATDGYAFTEVAGEGVHEIPVGPVHAGIIEPGHFRFSVVGEKVLRLEERLGYKHKGIEKRFEQLSLAEGARLAGRVSGDSTVAYAWAYAMAAEAVTRTESPARAAPLRGIALELERIANHLGDLGYLGNDVSFSFGFFQFWRLKEELLRLNAQLFGHRYLMDLVVPGGVARDLARQDAEKLIERLDRLRSEVETLRSIYDEHAGAQDRFILTGQIAPALAARMGMSGFAARASGVKHDLRVDVAIPPYEQLGVQAASHQRGDVGARLSVRFDELFESIRLVQALARDLPPGPVSAPLAPAASNERGIGWVEGWRGEVLIALETDAAGGLHRVHPHDPSWQNWPLLERAVLGNIVPDFPLINKSFNLSYSGHDL